MKKVFSLPAVLLVMLACNNPDQNTATGNTVDSVHSMDSNATDANEATGPGVDNTGGIISDTSKNKISTDSSHHK